MRPWTKALVIAAVLAMTVPSLPHAGADDTASTTSETQVAEPEPKPKKTPPNPVKRYNVVRKLVFPIVGPTYFHSSFGACRDNCTREHHGNDIMTWRWKGLPVVAATDGTVTQITYDDGGNLGCSVTIKDRYRWQTRYAHLNNDTPGTDDPGYSCVAPGIEIGSKVKAGQIIGYVGDSGNAEHTPAHIHFELRMPNGHPVDPWRSLKKAERINYEILPTDFSAATLILTDHIKSGDADTTVVVTTDEADQLMASEDQPMWLDAPIVAIDLSDPEPALAEIARLGSRAIVIMSDLDTRSLRDTLAGAASIVEQVPLPTFEPEQISFVPDATAPPVAEVNPADSFATIIAGRTTKIWRSRQETFHSFAADHRSIVIDSDAYAPRNIGHRSWTSPGRYADKNVLWWATGSGWVSTESIDNVPEFGYAYVSERRATVGTLNFLGSLAELPRMPIWRG